MKRVQSLTFIKIPVRAVRTGLKNFLKRIPGIDKWQGIARNAFRYIRTHKLYASAFTLLILGILYGFSLPKTLFKSPHSLVMLSSNGTLLGARIADDGQWRFPMEKTVPEKFEKCILAFEDKRFYKHPGVDVLAIGRALRANIKEHRRVSGASTISMQVIRLSRNHPKRNIPEKILEMVLATRLELRYTKKEIMAIYAANAPFGGNVVGLEAASWRYYGKSSSKLSWGEMAALSVLPNSPTLVHPGRNHDILKAKRDFVLWKLKMSGYIDSLTCVAAQREPLPAKPFELPSYAPHLLERMYADLSKSKNGEEVVRSTINLRMQELANKAIANHYPDLSGNGVNNAAALIIDVKTGDVLAYTGNTNAAGSENANQVDNIVAPRSTGSILKPLLYASLLQDGTILPDMLIPDIPTNLNGYTPKNFNYDYDGAVPASMALSRSLNIPAVRMLQMYGAQNFTRQLNRLGFTTINKPGNYYGLTLILGGAEVNLWDLAGVYASLSRTLTHYDETGGMYRASDFRPANFYKNKSFRPDAREPDLKNAPVLNASSIWLTFEAMVKVARPDEEKFWNNFAGSYKIAWKTGTSFGNRDAWAVGCTPDYVVAVWAGNSSGEGRPGLTGIGSAAPILFDIFNAMPEKSKWFDRPDNDMATVTVCKQSGELATDICPDKIEQLVPKNGVNSRPCPYHQYVFLDFDQKYQVQSDCECVSNMIKKPWFVLPAAEEAFYKIRHADYAQLPPYRKDCAPVISNGKEKRSFSLVYPQRNTRIYLPVNLDGKIVSTVFEAVHRDIHATIYWHLDDTYLGSTTDGLHQMAIAPAPGNHVLTLLDNNGEKIVQRFEIVKRMRQ